MKNKEINYALVEEKRPPIYTAMKYWGKKPHNIWHEYIECYTPEKGKFLDPFSGSAMSAFEAINAGKIAYAFDLNPLTSFTIEVLSSNFNYNKFKDVVEKILCDVENDNVYLNEYKTKCDLCGKNANIINFKWDSGKIYEIAIECTHCNKRYTLTNNDCDLSAFYPQEINQKYWYPEWVFNSSDAYSNSFVKNIGGNHFSDLWTKRNLYILSKIFNAIELQEDDNIKKQLLYGFIQTVHLCSKMCVPRSKDANRDFSTSWGRSAYICAKRQMEMNPLHLFYSSCLGKQSVTSALISASKYLKTKPIIYDINSNKPINDGTNLFYGIVDIKNIDKVIKAESIDFILTDPPYGGLVKYLDLCSIWLSWLYKINKKYLPDYKNEITVTNGNFESFYDDFLVGLQKLYKILKPQSKIVFTFNNQDMQVWNVFLNAIVDAGFKIEKVLHQQNKRSGESNVASKFGTSSSDYYIRCIKSDKIIHNSKITNQEFENFIVDCVESIIKERKEPTNYDILFAGILGRLSCANIDIRNCNKKIEDILKKYIDIKFTVSFENGYKWYIVDYKPVGKTLTQKVYDTVQTYVNNHKNVNKEKLLGIIFKTFPNGLTPDPISVDKIIDSILKEQ